jgi:hypothetical protein
MYRYVLACFLEAAEVPGINRAPLKEIYSIAIGDTRSEEKDPL